MSSLSSNIARQTGALRSISQRLHARTIAYKPGQTRPTLFRGLIASERSGFPTSRKSPMALHSSKMATLSKSQEDVQQPLLAHREQEKTQHRQKAEAGTQNMKPPSNSRYHPDVSPAEQEGLTKDAKFAEAGRREASLGAESPEANLAGREDDVQTSSRGLSGSNLEDVTPHDAEDNLTGAEAGGNGSEGVADTYNPTKLGTNATPSDKGLGKRSGLNAGMSMPKNGVRSNGLSDTPSRGLHNESNSKIKSRLPGIPQDASSDGKYSKTAGNLTATDESGAKETQVASGYGSLSGAASSSDNYKDKQSATSQANPDPMVWATKHEEGKMPLNVNQGSEGSEAALPHINRVIEDTTSSLKNMASKITGSASQLKQNVTDRLTGGNRPYSTSTRLAQKSNDQHVSEMASKNHPVNNDHEDKNKIFNKKDDASLVKETIKHAKKMYTEEAKEKKGAMRHELDKDYQTVQPQQGPVGGV